MSGRLAAIALLGSVTQLVFGRRAQTLSGMATGLGTRNCGDGSGGPGRGGAGGGRRRGAQRRQVCLYALSSLAKRLANPFETPAAIFEFIHCALAVLHLLEIKRYYIDLQCAAICQPPLVVDLRSWPQKTDYTQSNKNTETKKDDVFLNTLIK